MNNKNSIAGLIIKELKSHPDDRGFFREVIRHTDDFFENGKFSQWSHSKMTKNVVKAWHYHHLQIDWWYVATGVVEAVFFDNREESPTYKSKVIVYMGDKEENDKASAVCIKIPQGVLHGLKVISNVANLFYITSEVYNPNDEGRFPFNSKLVGHDWGEGVITVENDRREFVPTAERKVLLT